MLHEQGSGGPSMLQSPLAVLQILLTHKAYECNRA